MAKQTIAAIYEVDASGMTGPRVGEGTLIAPLWVLVHPPLSVNIAAGTGPTRFRAGLRSDPATGPLIEIIDAEEAVVIGVTAVGRPLVGVKLRTRAVSPLDRSRELSEARNVDELVERVVPLLESGDSGQWGRGDDKNRNVFLCGLFGILC